MSPACHRRRRPTPPARDMLVPADGELCMSIVYATRKQTGRCSDEVERRDQVRHPAYVKPETSRRRRIRSGPGHQAEGPGPLSLLLAVCDPRPLQPLRRGLDGGGQGERPPGRLIEQTCAKQRIQPQQPRFTPTAARQQTRRPLQVRPVSHVKRLPCAASTIPKGDGRKTRPIGTCVTAPASRAYAASGAIRQRTTTPRNLADRRMDQSAVENDPPGCPRTEPW